MSPEHFFSTLPARTIVPLLQTAYQANAAHMNFGKYTLLLCYGTTTNSNTFPIALAIVFGNETKDSWVKFWQFAKGVHPCLNTPQTTIITDQAKGSVDVIHEILPLAKNFYCLYHHCQNIANFFKGGKGKYPCLWMYNLLTKASLMESITWLKFEHSSHVSDKALHYLNVVNDDEQYPTARCAISKCVYMYQRSSSSAVESMNRANMAVQERTAVDVVNSTILLLKLESAQFNKNKSKVWEWSEPLTPHGKKLCDDTFSGVNFWEYKIYVTNRDTFWECNVAKHGRLNLESTYTFLQEEEKGSVFGGCTCGVPNKDEVPCQHMVAVVKQVGLKD